jgi:hypothetical protein
MSSPRSTLLRRTTSGIIARKRPLQQALQTYGTDHVLGTTVSNEFMLNYILEHKASSATSALLKGENCRYRQMLASMNINLPVGIDDAGSYFNNDLLVRRGLWVRVSFFNIWEQRCFR